MQQENVNYASSINCRAHEPREEDDKVSREDGVSGGVSWLKTGRGMRISCPTILTILIFTDYEEENQ